MRTKNTIRNILFNVLNLLVPGILGFICRRIFVATLGTAYLGLTSLIINILSMLSLVELGIGTAIVYSLYAPLANENWDESSALVKLYAKIYRVLAQIVAVVGLLVVPFLGVFVKHSVNVHFAQFLFVLYLLDTVEAYLFSHKRSLLNADQKSYIATSVDMVFRITVNIAQIVALAITKSLVVYVAIQITCNLVGNLTVNWIVDKKYKHILSIRGQDLAPGITKTIIRNVKALFMHRIGELCLGSTASLVLSYFLNLSVVGIYNNYCMVIAVFNSIVVQIFTAMTASFGNLISTESSEHTYEKFRVAYFMNFCLVSTMTVMLYSQLNPFIQLWLGKGCLVHLLAYHLFIFNFYTMGMRSSIGSFKMAGGIYYQDRYAPLIESILNLSVSIILVKHLGLAGVLLGTIISNCLVPVWVQPYMVYKYVFGKSLIEYIKIYLFYAMLTCVALIAVHFGNLPINPSWIELILTTTMLVLFMFILYFLIFYRTKEMQYLVVRNFGRTLFSNSRGSR